MAKDEIHAIDDLNAAAYSDKSSSNIIGVGTVFPNPHEPLMVLSASITRICASHSVSLTFCISPLIQIFNSIGKHPLRSISHKVYSK